MKDLVEIANFPTAVTVPEGDDFMDLLAEDIEAIAQVLANRTQYLKGFTDLAALTNMDPVQFAGRIMSLRKDDPTKAAFHAPYGPHDATGLPTNKWTLTLRAKLTGTKELRVYQGDGTEGWVAITINASYDALAGTPSWKYDDGAAKAHAFMLIGSDSWFVHTHEGSDHWTVWDNLSARVFAHTVAGDHVTTTNEFDYESAAPHAERVNISRVLGQALIDRTGGIGSIMFQSDVSATKYTVSGVDKCDLIFPLDLKRDTVVSSIVIEMNHASSASSSDVFTLRKRHGALSSISYDDVVHASPSTGVGEKTVTLTPGAPFTVARGEEYSIVWTLADLSGLNAAKVFGIDINCTQPGPRP